MGLLNPNNLFWAISIAVLLAVYLRSRSRPTLEVSSLLLFEQAPAPVTRVRRPHIDALFWLETGILAALALALAGLYIRTPPVAVQGNNRALVFDLAAGMNARDDGGTRLDRAKKDAIAIIDSAPDRDQFSVIGYALEAELIHSETANRRTLDKAILAMQPMAVAGRGAAQAAALMRARAAGAVDLFADRPPPSSIIADAGLSSHFHFHRAGSPADNLALVSLDPGIPNNAQGRVVLKSFAHQPRVCELAIDAGGETVFHQTLILEPTEQVTVPFGPLTTGGLVRARILSPDALEADNERYAYAPAENPSHVIVLSPDPAVRDDIARVLLAVNRNFIVTVADPAKFSSADEYSLAVMHDCYALVKARSILLVFPPSGSSLPVANLRATGTVAAAHMITRERVNSSTTPTALGATRIVSVPEWMTPRASGVAAGLHDTLPLTAIGFLPEGSFGLISFDIRDHLLLDPDRLDALIAMVELVRELTAPMQLQVVPTGTFLAIPAAQDAKVVAPDGRVVSASRDQWGRLRFRPLQTGHFSIGSGSAKVDVYSNYYDAAESDLSAGSSPSAFPSVKSSDAIQSISGPPLLEPLSAILIAVALFAIALESGLLLRRANRWGSGNV